VLELVTKLLARAKSKRAKWLSQAFATVFGISFGTTHLIERVSLFELVRVLVIKS
jgi:hypothetical protein